jgi:hypothetical protein
MGRCHVHIDLFIIPLLNYPTDMMQVRFKYTRRFINVCVELFTGMCIICVSTVRVEGS